MEEADCSLQERESDLKAEFTSIENGYLKMIDGKEAEIARLEKTVARLQKTVLRGQNASSLIQNRRPPRLSLLAPWPE